MDEMDEATKATLSKLPEVTLSFWIIKIGATTLGETGGDSVTMTLSWGYLVGTAIFLAALITLVACQIAAKKFHPFLYWATIVASTTFGTTMADFADRSLGIGYTGGSTLLFLCLMTVLGLWYWSQGTISVNTVSTPKVEAFYWVAITFSQTLGTALGDWLADTGGLGYEGGALVFGAGLGILAAAYYWTKSLAGRLVLGSIYPDQTARSHSWRLPRQAGRPRRPRFEPTNCIRRNRRFHRRLHFAIAAAPRKTSGRSSSKRRVTGGRARNRRRSPTGATFMIGAHVCLSFLSAHSGPAKQRTQIRFQ